MRIFFTFTKTHFISVKYLFICKLQKMPLKLYYIIASPPARSVILTLKTLNIPHELHVMNLLEGEHRSEAYLKVSYIIGVW